MVDYYTTYVVDNVEAVYHCISYFYKTVPNNYFVLVENVLTNKATVISQGRSGLPCEFDAYLW